MTSTNDMPSYPPQPPATDYGSQPWPPGYSYPARPSNGKAVAAMVLGILSVVFGWAYGLSLVLGILAVVFAVQFRRTHNPDGRGMATAGLVTGILGIVFGASMLLILILVIATA